MSYDVNGDFGKVRHIKLPSGNCQVKVPFKIISAGWHCCNDKYRIQRDSGFSHGHLLLFSISSGGRLKMADQDVLELPAASVIWIPPNCKHTYYTGSGELWELYWLHIEDHTLLNLDNIFHNRPWISISHMERFRHEFERMLCEKTLNDEELSIEHSRQISSVYHLLLQESYMQHNIYKHNGDELVHSIIREMEGDCQKDWKLQQLSEQYYLSVPQLIRRFKAETNMTPYAYLLKIRLKTAAMYLQYTGMSVDEISHKTGFVNTSNFILQFRKCYGMTPLQYRNK